MGEGHEQEPEMNFLHALYAFHGGILQNASKMLKNGQKT